MFVALALVFVNSLPLIERSLKTSTAQAAASTFAGEDGAPDALASGTDGYAFALEHNAEAGEIAFDDVAASAPPIYDVGALDENANEQQMKQETLRQATPSAILGTGTLSVPHRLTRGSGELIIRGAAISMQASASRAGVTSNENEGLNSLLEKVGPHYTKCTMLLLVNTV